MRSGGQKKVLGRGGLIAALFMIVALLFGCSGGVVLDPDEGSFSEPRVIARARVPENSVETIAEKKPTEISLTAAQTFFDSAQIVVLAGANEPAAINRAASIAVTLGTPLLLTAPPGQTSSGQSADSANGQPLGSLNTELLRLGVRAVVTVGAVSLHQVDTTALIVSPAPEKIGDLEDLLGRSLIADAGPVQADEGLAIAQLEVGTIYEVEGLESGPSSYGTLPKTLDAERINDVIVLAETDTRYLAAVATARAAGGSVLVGNQPASESQTITDLSKHSRWPVVGLGNEFSASGTFEHLVDKMRAGKTLPAGGQNLFFTDAEMVRIIAVDSEVALSEEAIDNAGDVFEYAEEFVSEYVRLGNGPATSAVEVPVATTSLKDIAYWVEQADANDALLTLVFTAPKGSLLSLVSRYEHVLAHPHVGVRFELPAKSSSRQSVDSGEINDVAVFLQQLVRKNKLPQKLLLLEVSNPEQLGHPESLLPSGDDVAIGISTAAPSKKDQLALWKTLHEWNLDHTYWGWTLIPLTDDDEEDVTYHSPQDTLKDVDPNIVTYR